MGVFNFVKLCGFDSFSEFFLHAIVAGTLKTSGVAFQSLVEDRHLIDFSFHNPESSFININTELGLTDDSLKLSCS
jgi:hypothetical protein